LVIAGGVWTALMALWAFVLLDGVRGQEGAQIVVVAPFGLWVVGLGVLAFIAGTRTSVGGYRPGPPLICTNCGTALYSQWRHDDHFDCRNCGTETAGRPPDEAPAP
jgi:hypothetical protein